MPLAIDTLNVTFAILAVKSKLEDLSSSSIEATIQKANPMNCYPYEGHSLRPAKLDFGRPAKERRECGGLAKNHNAKAARYS